MTQLVTLRSRIKAVETVKKTTNAMRLIAMSTHVRLRQHKEHLTFYQQTLKNLLNNIPIPEQSEHVSNQTLVIAIGSQKGLCGNFNNTLAKFFMLHKPQEPYTLMVIGKQLHRIFAASSQTINGYYDSFSIQNYHTIARELARAIKAHHYKKITVYAQTPKTFFIQKPTIFELLPLENRQDSSTRNHYSLEEPTELYHHALHTYILTQLDVLLSQSLLAEQSARFLSMDNATRNADSLLNKMQLDYNKLRQTNITRELTDLSSSLL